MMVVSSRLVNSTAAAGAWVEAYDSDPGRSESIEYVVG